MNKLIAAVVLSMFAITAAAQSGGLPPEQAPAGNPAKFKTKKDKPADATTAAPADATATKPVTPADKRAARKAKRAEKVGPKPLD